MKYCMEAGVRGPRGSCGNVPQTHTHTHRPNKVSCGLPTIFLNQLALLSLPLSSSVERVSDDVGLGDPGADTAYGTGGRYGVGDCANN